MLSLISLLSCTTSSMVLRIINGFITRWRHWITNSFCSWASSAFFLFESKLKHSFKYSLTTNKLDISKFSKPQKSLVFPKESCLLPEYAAMIVVLAHLRQYKSNLSFFFCKSHLR
jgi:hypothetical protein